MKGKTGVTKQKTRIRPGTKRVSRTKKGIHKEDDFSPVRLIGMSRGEKFIVVSMLIIFSMSVGSAQVTPWRVAVFTNRCVVAA